MKKISTFLGLTAVLCSAILFTGCPVSTRFPLGENGGEKIDKHLIGTWRNDSTNSEVVRVTFSKADEYSYKVKVDEKGAMYATDGTDFVAWLTTIGDKRFLVLHEFKDGAPTENYWQYNIEIADKQIITHDFSLKVGGTDAVTSTEAYREEVSASMKKDDFIANTIVWHK